MASKEERRWEAENDLRTLQESNRILKDKKRLSAAMKIAEEQKGALEDLHKKHGLRGNRKK